MPQPSRPRPAIVIMSTEEQNITFMLTPDNPSNCTLALPTGATAYIAATRILKNSLTTEVSNARGEVIASSQWRDVLPDKVTIGNRKPMSLGDWMKKSLIPYKDDLTFTDDAGRKYKWKGNAPGRSFELYCEDDNYTSAISRFNRSRRALTASTPNITGMDPVASAVSSTPTLVEQQKMYTPATLVLTPRAAEIQDTVVVSFLFLEKTRRNRERDQDREFAAGFMPQMISGTVQPAS